MYGTYRSFYGERTTFVSLSYGQCGSTLGEASKFIWASHGHGRDQALGTLYVAFLSVSATSWVASKGTKTTISTKIGCWTPRK